MVTITTPLLIHGAQQLVQDLDSAVFAGWVPFYNGICCVTLRSFPLLHVIMIEMLEGPLLHVMIEMLGGPLLDIESSVHWPTWYIFIYNADRCW